LLAGLAIEVRLGAGYRVVSKIAVEEFEMTLDVARVESN
jgi:hypothetical protein